MKRAIFKRQSIDVCIERMLTATPITPATLSFDPGERLVVATPKSEAPPGLGEYQFLFTVGDYVGERPDLGRGLFGRSEWKHVYRLTSVTSVEPFSLEDVVAAAGERAPEVRYRYKGQTQHHRIIRTIWPEDVDLWEMLIKPGRDPVRSAGEVLVAAEDEAERRQAHELSHAEIVRRLKRMNRQNETVPAGKEYRPGRAQKRNRRFAALVKALYGGQCQVCGLCIAADGGSPQAASVHHLEPWSGDASDRLDNVMCVCPNHHAMFELGTMRWTGDELLIRDPQGGWINRPLLLDLHLLTPLSADAETLAVPAAVGEP